MQHPPMGGFPRPPFVPYPSIYPGPFHSAASSMPLPSPSFDSQPPGVSPLGMSPFALSTTTSTSQSLVISGTQTGLPPQGIGMLRVSC